MRGAGEAEAAALATVEPLDDVPRPLRARRAAATQAAELIARVTQASGGEGDEPSGSRGRSRPRTALAPPADAVFGPEPSLYNAVAMDEFDIGDFLSLMLPPPEPAASAPPAPPARAPAATDDALAGMQASTVHVKFPNLMSPATLPQGLNGAALAMFAAPPIAMTALSRPGCVLLTLDALLDGGGLLSARDAVAALKSGGAGSFFRSQPFSVAAPTSFATSGEDGSVRADDVAAQAPPPRVRPIAALAGTEVALRFLSPGCAKDCACDADDAFAARLHGHALQLRPRRGGGATLLSASSSEGVALIEVLPKGMEPQHAPPPRPVLLCADAAIVAEVCAAADAVGDSGDAADAVELAAHVLGTALRPGARIAVLAAACAAAAERGWAVALVRLLPRLRAAAEATAPLERDDGAAVARLCTRGGASLLHRACAARAASAAALLISDGGIFGAFATRGPDSLTPAHHAAIAAAADGGALMSMLTASGDGLLAWFYARDGNGVPPADYAPAALNVPLLKRLAAARARADDAVAAVLSRAFLRPELAALEALTQLAHDDDAAAILRWVHAAMMRADDGDGGDGGSTQTKGRSSVVDDDGFTRWQAAEGRSLWRVMSLLLLLKAVGNVVHCMRFLVYGPDSAGAAARAFIASTPLLDPSTGASVLATELPLDALRRGAWHMLLATALFRVPHGAAAIWLVYSRAGWALTLARHETVMCAVLLGEALFFIYTDALLRYVTGGLEVEWPAKLMLLRALAITFAMRTGPFRTAANRAGMLARAASSGVALALRPALRGRLWHNVGYRTTIILLLAETLAERANQRRLRHAYSAHVAKQQQANAEHKSGKHD